jgi:hypothetical protein
MKGLAMRTKKLFILMAMAAGLLCFDATGALAQQQNSTSMVYKPPPAQQQNNSPTAQDLMDQYMAARGGAQAQASREADLQSALSQKAMLNQQMASGLGMPTAIMGMPGMGTSAYQRPPSYSSRGSSGPKYRYINKDATDVSMPPRLFNNIPKRRP